MPEKKRISYDGVVPEKVEAAINIAIGDEQDFVNEGRENQPNVYLSYDEDLDQRISENPAKIPQQTNNLKVRPRINKQAVRQQM
jgi:hypothetical protein